MKVELVRACGLPIAGAWNIGPVLWKKQSTCCILQNLRKVFHSKLHQISNFLIVLRKCLPTMSNLYLFLSVKETKFSLWLAPFLCYVVALCESMKLQLENVQEMFFFFFPTLNNSLHFLFGYL